MKKTRDISVTRSWSLRVVTYHARCFDSFRFANARFRFIVLTLNDRSIVMRVVAAHTHELMGLIEQPLSLRFTPLIPIHLLHIPIHIPIHIPTTSVSCVVMHVGKSREILIAVRCHFASEIEGGHLDPSRRDDTEPFRDCGMILCPSPRWPLCIAFYKETRKFQNAILSTAVEKNLLGNTFSSQLIFCWLKNW